jgi:hypothetical protein
MNALAVLAVILSGGCGADQPRDDQTAIQGEWHATGRAEHIKLIFCGETLLGINLRINDPRWDMMRSTFKLGEGTIDIERPEGLQLGLYSIEGDTLTLRLFGAIDQRAQLGLRKYPLWLAEPITTQGCDG